MTSSARGTPAMPENWLDAPPVSPAERIHLHALQGVQVLSLVSASELAGA